MVEIKYLTKPNFGAFRIGAFSIRLGDMYFEK